MNVRVNLNTPITDGTEVVFRSPVDCSQVTGLIVYSPGGSQEFAFADAHGNNVGDIDHLFAENVVVKVILDTVHSMAFVQNADTNAYIERTFDSLIHSRDASVLTKNSVFVDGYIDDKGKLVYDENFKTSDYVELQKGVAYQCDYRASYYVYPDEIVTTSPASVYLYTVHKNLSRKLSSDDLTNIVLQGNETYLRLTHFPGAGELQTLRIYPKDKGYKTILNPDVDIPQIQECREEFEERLQNIEDRIENGGGGSTPVKGVDYWTEEDIAEIKSYVDDAILGGEW